jgi:hypothetical protein
MAFENSTRNRLQRLVGECRYLLTAEFDAQLQEFFGIYAGEGRVLPLEKLPALDDDRLRVGRLLRKRIEHLAASAGDNASAIGDAVRRVLREQAFTVLNRFAALRMAEERGIIIESVGGGLNSKGFKTFSEVAFSGLGGGYERYCVFLFCMFDEMATDLGVLFDQASPYGLLFPRENVLLQLFDLLNAAEIKPLWGQDETIGWIYQYYNDPAERKKMREESSAPRNSRELAVRNQFFTPRYVVEFLTDNTLGRIWSEMTAGVTCLREKCRYLLRRPNEIFLKPGENAPESLASSGAVSQEDLLKQPVHIPHRPVKDPRRILMLDPACGSMHFGLYAFDLFEVIYDEAWEIAKSGNVPPGADPAFSNFQRLTSEFSTKEAFLREVPRFIIEHNLHGIDIDPRAAQIAGLSLWLRAQKSWQGLGLKPADRPIIKRSNIVCAEPMPGEKELLREFVEREFPAEERVVYLRLLEAIFDKMQLAGEAGSLLKIEAEIRSAIAVAKKNWEERRQEFFDPAEITNLSRRSGTQRELPALNTQPQSSTINLSDESFWERIEERIYAALRDYAEQAENGGGFQRRLFAEDAARGFAFIDVCRKRYDVVLMNPPFGEPVSKKSDWVKKGYKSQPLDLYCFFLLRTSEIAQPSGFVGCITSASFKTYVDYLRFRTTFITSGMTSSFLDLGWGVLDQAYVEAAAYTIRPDAFGPQVIPFIDLREERDKGTALADALHGPKSELVHWRAPQLFRQLLDSPLIYWWSEERLRFFSGLPILSSLCEEIGKGAGPHAIFYRLRWEVPPSGVGLGNRWAPFANGGAFSPFRRDDVLLLEWSRCGELVKSYILQKYPYLGGNTEWNIQLEGFYGRPGITYGKKTTNFSAQTLTSGCVFSFEGIGIFPQNRDSFEWVLAYLNSRFVSWFLNTTCGLHKNPPYLMKLPLPRFEEEDRRRLANQFTIGWQSQAAASATRESSSVFVVPFRDSTPHLGSSNKSDTHSIQIAKALECIDNLVLTCLGLSKSDLKEGQRIDDEDSSDVATNVVSQADAVVDVASYVVGCSFGRWDIRYATGEQAAPDLPNPFAPLPVCPPGQLQNAQGLPARPEDVPASYPVKNIPWDGILVDDPNHPLDIERRVREVIEIIWKDRAEAIEHEACEILGVKSLRDYFRKPSGFFANHVKRYSKSRRQAPIYWPLSTPSGSYTLWIYYHRLTDQTLFHCLNEFVKPKLVEVEADLARMRSGTGEASSTRNEVERLVTLQKELLEFRDELLRLAHLPYKPNLNDGVLITASPLWKLFRLSKWQKDLKACWTALESGEYDWSHLAYSLWPDRVKRLCANDLSIAIAHGLENLCKTEQPEKRSKKRGKMPVSESEQEFNV